MGLTIAVKSGGKKYDRGDTAFVDYDEIDGVIAGLDYITKLDKGVTKLDNFQADFQSKGDLQLSIAHSESGILFVIKCGSIGATPVLFESTDIPKFRALLVNAKTLLESLSK